MPTYIMAFEINDTNSYIGITKVSICKEPTKVEKTGSGNFLNWYHDPEYALVVEEMTQIQNDKMLRISDQIERQ